MSEICRFPEANVIFTVCSSDVTNSDSDRLWGTGRFTAAGPDPCVHWVHGDLKDRAGVIVHVPQVPDVAVFSELSKRFSPYFMELVGMCRDAGVRYLMFDRDATPVRNEPLWGDRA